MALLSAISYQLSAGATAQGGAITIEPFYQEIVIPDKAKNSYFIKLTNNTNKQQNFRLKTADFGSLDETGGVAFIGITKPDVNYKYGLTTWLSLDQQFVVLRPGETQQIEFAITKIDSLTAGGHYGAILVTPDTGEKQTDNSTVEVSPVVSSLILLKKVGGEIYNLGLKSSISDDSLFSLPSRVTLRFANDGNVHIVPRGTVTVTDSRGAIISEGLINADSGYILPESIRQFQTSLKNVKNAWLPGYYNLNIKYRYDGNDSFTTKTIRLFYVGQASRALVLVIVTAGLILLVIKRKKLIKSIRKN